jgi:HEAT repeat protein
MPLIRNGLPPRESAAEPEASLTELRARLGDPNAEQRRTAARSLGAYSEAGSALCRAAVAETNDSVREAIFTALIRIGSPAADALVPLLASENAPLRNAAIEALKTMPEAVGAHFDQIISGPTDVRIFGVEIVGGLQHPDTPRRLIRVIEEDAELNVCAAAVEALAECGEPEAIEPLKRLLTRFPDEPFLKFAVDTALKRIA